MCLFLEMHLYVQALFWQSGKGDDVRKRGLGTNPVGDASTTVTRQPRHRQMHGCREGGGGGGGGENGVQVWLQLPNPR